MRGLIWFLVMALIGTYLLSPHGHPPQFTQGQLTPTEIRSAIQHCRDSTHASVISTQDMGAHRLYLELESPTYQATCFTQFGKVTSITMSKKNRH